MRGNFKSAQIRLLGLLLLFLITASGVFAFSSAKSHQGKPPVSVETALKAIDFAAENHISIDSEFSANLRQSINFNRNYSPALGRFVSKGPIGFAADVNLYRYADNNLVLFVDSFGLAVSGDILIRYVGSWIKDSGAQANSTAIIADWSAAYQKCSSVVVNLGEQCEKGLGIWQVSATISLSPPSASSGSKKNDFNIHSSGKLHKLFVANIWT